MGLRWTIYCDAEYLKRTFKRCFLLCFMYIKNKQLYILYHNLKREFHLKGFEFPSNQQFNFMAL